jgi:hypothetical protein
VVKHWIVVIAIVAGCKGKATEAKQVCERAATRFEGCMRELLGPEGAAMARSAPDGMEACTKDDKTVAMYQRCLPSETCGAFLDCLEDTVRDARVKVDPTAPRAEQCAVHVEDGLRGIALQVVLMNEIAKREPDKMRSVQACVLDEALRWDGCVSNQEIDEVNRYARQRQTECEAWDGPLAACILGLPGAKDCDPDSEPVWRLPRQIGVTGPAIAWSIDVDVEDDDDDVWTAWAPGGVLLVKDATSVRAVKGGDVVWTAQVDVKDRALALAGTTLYGISSDAHELVAIDIANGKVSAPLPGHRLEIVGAAGTRALVETTDSLIFEVERGKAKKLGQVDEDDAIEPAWIGLSGDTIAMTNADQLLLVDRKAKTVFQLSGADEIDDLVLAGDDVILQDDKGLAIASLRECRARGLTVELASTRDDLGCIRARHKISMMMTVTPTPVPGHAVAFNDHGITGKTQLFGIDATPWAIETDASGEVIADERLVYTVSYGPDSEGPVRLLALDKANGAPLWHTDLAAKPPEDGEVTFALTSDAIAVRVGAKVHVIRLSKRT